jgi:predicted ArsR family transcriptional regulator
MRPGDFVAMNSMDSLDPTEVAILKFLAVKSTATGGLIAENLKTSSVRVDYYLTKLEQAYFIVGSHFYTGRPSHYQLGQKGREFLVVNNLID